MTINSVVIYQSSIQCQCLLPFPPNTVSRQSGRGRTRSEVDFRVGQCLAQAADISAYARTSHMHTTVDNRLVSSSPSACRVYAPAFALPSQLDQVRRSILHAPFAMGTPKASMIWSPLYSFSFPSVHHTLPSLLFRSTMQRLRGLGSRVYRFRILTEKNVGQPSKTWSSDETVVSRGAASRSCVYASRTLYILDFEVGRTSFDLGALSSIA